MNCQHGVAYQYVKNGMVKCQACEGSLGSGLLGTLVCCSGSISVSDFLADDFAKKLLIQEKLAQLDNSYIVE